MKFFKFYKKNNHIHINLWKIKIRFRYRGISNYRKLYTLCEIQNLDKLLKQGLRCDHPIGIVMHYKEFGYNNHIYQNVTIGAKRGFKSKYPDDYPTIGNNIIVYAGAVICGGITVGDNAEIGANAVVVDDVPPNAIVAGIPAKIIRYKDIKQNNNSK